MAIIKEGTIQMADGKPKGVPPSERELQVINIFYQEAGKDIADRCVAFHGGNKEYAANWFYTCRMPSLNNRTPAELCRENRLSELEQIIGAK